MVKSKNTIIFIILCSIVLLGTSVLMIIDLAPQTFIEILSDDDFKKNGFEGSGTQEDPYVLENKILGFISNGKESFEPILAIQNTNKYFEIRNCTFLSGSVAVYLLDVKRGSAKIYNNTMVAGFYCVIDVCSVSEGAILIENSEEVLITNNNIIPDVWWSTYSQKWKYESYGWGIHLINSSYAVIRDNNISYVGEGIVLEVSNYVIVENNFVEKVYDSVLIYHSDFVNIKNNELQGYNGIYVGSSEFLLLENNRIYTLISQYNIGLELHNISDCLIANNTISTFDTLIKFDLSSFCYVSYNKFDNASSYAIIVDNQNNNLTIYHNTFWENNLNGTSQCLDNGVNNTWYNPLINSGNYWSDLGSNVTYFIAGTAMKYDLYPLSYPFVSFFSQKKEIIEH